MSENKGVTPKKLAAAVSIIVAAFVSIVLVSSAASSYNGMKSMFDTAEDVSLEELAYTYGSDSLGYFSSASEMKELSSSDSLMSYSSGDNVVSLIDISKIDMDEEDSDVRETVDGMVELPKQSENLLNVLYNKGYFIEKISLGDTNGILCSGSEAIDELRDAIATDYEEIMCYLSESGRVIFVSGESESLSKLIKTYKESD